MPSKAKHRTIHEFQQLMRRTYLRRDKKRGLDATVLWLVCEIGELADAVLKEKPAGKEAADVFAWLCSVCNLIDIDLESASFKKYGRGCPRCRRESCICQDV
jgi:NTP pyrophosphatase (non-canonical NTP hydrolase)